MAWTGNSSGPIKYKHGQYVLAGLLFALLLVVGFIIWFVMSRLIQPQPVETTQITNVENVTELLSEPEATVPEFDAIALQVVIDNWTANSGGIASVVIADVDGNVIASHGGDDIYFAASIYKLYVAYAGYQQVDKGLVDPTEIYINGHTRAECLDLMIRESDSPCAEKLWNELGKQDLTEQLKTYGINNTSMTGITTTAQDAATMLARIARGEGLSVESQASYLSSMQDQDPIYRRGLPSGFTDITVYNKVGWNESTEWHDTSILGLPDGSQLIVTVFTENVGYTNISKLGSIIEEVITR